MAPASKRSKRSKPTKRKGFSKAGKQKAYASKSSAKPYKKTLTAKVANLTKTVNLSLATHTHRRRVVEAILAVANQQTFQTIQVNTKNLLEGAMTTFRYYNPEDPSVLVTTNEAVGAFHRDIIVKSFWTRLSIRNNYQVPADIRAYLCVPKKDTSLSPTEMFQEGVDENQSPATTISASVLMHLTDSDIFNELFTIKKSVSKTLQAGSTCSLSYVANNWTYDPSLADDHANTYVRANRGCAWVVFVNGVLSHGTSDTICLGAAKIDTLVDTKWVFQYDAGTNLSDYSISDNVNEPAGNPTVSNKPISGQQVFATP